MVSAGRTDTSSTAFRPLMEKINQSVLDKTVRLCRERKITIPTFAQQKDPSTVPAPIRERLKNVGLWDVDPANLFRITWKNEPKAKGGGYNNGNWLELPPAITGVPCRIVGLVGKYFPTGAQSRRRLRLPRPAPRHRPVRSHHAKSRLAQHRQLLPRRRLRLRLLACHAVAILPEQMSRERFEWLASIGAEVIKTPGSESNVKEIYDACWDIKKNRKDCVIFNQFEEFGNSIWHYHVTGGIIDEIFNRIKKPGDRLSAYISATGSAGTIAAGDFLRTRYPQIRVVACEALQCPTLLACGFGEHRIEGIGDKHVPWIHNVRNTDVVVAVDDEQCMQLLRLFNEEAGRAFLEKQGVPKTLTAELGLLGISSICNIVSAVKTAKFFEMNEHDILFAPLTDSMEMYGSRVVEQREAHGPYNELAAARHYGRYIEGTAADNMRELSYHDRKQLHNFKYFTWVEQQGRSSNELRQLWDPDFWTQMFAQVGAWDKQIEEFNRAVAA